ncbi:hypothetical protein DFH09DRAFT_1275519 [Mycena vulgaris]|nr:hypothetical protein DFH09DRAFT_1275519 [Mycena vulgaris]
MFFAAGGLNLKSGKAEIRLDHTALLLISAFNNNVPGEAVLRLALGKRWRWASEISGTPNKDNLGISELPWHGGPGSEVLVPRTPSPRSSPATSPPSHPTRVLHATASHPAVATPGSPPPSKPSVLVPPSSWRQARARISAHTTAFVCYGRHLIGAVSISRASALRSACRRRPLQASRARSSSFSRGSASPNTIAGPPHTLLPVAVWEGVRARLFTASSRGMRDVQVSATPAFVRSFQVALVGSPRRPSDPPCEPALPARRSIFATRISELTLAPPNSRFARGGVD